MTTLSIDPNNGNLIITDDHSTTNLCFHPVLNPQHPKFKPLAGGLPCWLQGLSLQEGQAKQQYFHVDNGGPEIIIKRDATYHITVRAGYYGYIDIKYCWGWDVATYKKQVHALHKAICVYYHNVLTQAGLNNHEIVELLSSLNIP